MLPYRCFRVARVYDVALQLGHEILQNGICVDTHGYSGNDENNIILQDIIYWDVRRRVQGGSHEMSENGEP